LDARLPGLLLEAGAFWAVADNVEADGYPGCGEQAYNVQRAPDPLGLLHPPDEDQPERLAQVLSGSGGTPLLEFLVRQAGVEERNHVLGLVWPFTVDRHHAAHEVAPQPPPLKPVRPCLASLRGPVARVLDPARAGLLQQGEQDDSHQADVGRAAHMYGVGAAQLPQYDAHVARDAPQDARLAPERPPACRRDGYQFHVTGLIGYGALRRRAGMQRRDMHDPLEQRRQMVNLADGCAPADDLSPAPVMLSVRDDEELHVATIPRRTRSYSAALISHVCSLRARARAASPILARLPGSVRRTSTARAVAAGSSCGTANPVLPTPTASTRPELSETTAGLPHSAASTTAMPYPSKSPVSVCRLVMTKTSAALSTSTSVFASTRPRNRTCSATPSSRASASYACCSVGSPTIR